MITDTLRVLLFLTDDHREALSLFTDQWRSDVWYNTANSMSYLDFADARDDLIERGIVLTKRSDIGATLYRVSPLWLELEKLACI